MAVDKEKVAEESVTSRLFKIILSWDYFRLLKDSKVALLLLNYLLYFRFWSLAFFFFFYFLSSCKQKRKDDDGSSLGLKEVKASYKDVDDYISTFEPLLLEEVKAQIIQRNDNEEGIFTFMQ